MDPPLPFVILFLYFYPTIAAWFAGKRNMPAIFALNLLLGWTLVGWVVALVWSQMREEDQKRRGLLPFLRRRREATEAQKRKARIDNVPPDIF